MPLFPFSSSSCTFRKPKPPLFLLLSRVLFCSIPKLKNLCYRHRARALAEAQRALTDYLHSTRALPFSHADLIASNSPFSLSTLVSQIPFPPSPSSSDIPRTLRRFLSYRPVNEFEFFFESIGLAPFHPAVPSRAFSSPTTPIFFPPSPPSPASPSPGPASASSTARTPPSSPPLPPSSSPASTPSRPAASAASASSQSASPSPPP